MSALENILVLMDTIGYFEGYSESTGEEPFESYINKRREIHVLLPEDIEKIRDENKESSVEVSGKCKITCEDTDSYTMACKINQKYNLNDCADGPKCMVLNFANPYTPGGGVRRGAKAQEEDLCRRSSLLLSLESEEAKKYYAYNKANSVKDTYGNDYGTNSMMLTPFVEVIKDRRYEPNARAEVAVLTAAAPIIRDKLHVSENYQKQVYQRIHSVLLCATYYGYTHLVLGAWGCGAFGNNPEVMAGLFRNAIDNFSYNGKNVHQLFEIISFAVSYSEKKPANYRAFEERFTEYKKKA